MKLTWVVLAEHFGGGGDLLFQDSIVLLFLRVRLEALPGQRSAQKVHQHIAQGFQVISSGLFYKQSKKRA